MYQEDVLRTSSTILNANNLNIIEYEFTPQGDSKSEPSEQEAIDKILAGYEDTVLDNISKSMVETRFEDANQNKTEGIETWKDIVSSIDVKLTVDGVYENIKNAIEDLEELDNLVIVETMSIAKNTVYSNRVIGTIELKFPYYYDNETLERLDWSYESDFAQHLPFDYIVTGSLADPDRPIYDNRSSGLSDNGILSSYNDSIISSQIEELLDNKEESKPLEEDFEIVMSSYASIHQRYFIAKSGQRDISLSSTRDDEELTLTLSEDVNGYYFNYSNSFNSFPRPSEYFTFDPNYEDAIYVTVVSSPRVDAKDIGSGSVDIINKTTKPIKVIVKKR